MTSSDSSEYVHVTDDLRFASALTAAGFEIRNANNVMDHIQKREVAICELEHKHNGVDANELKKLSFNPKELERRVNEIIKIRGITQEEQVLLAFDAARAGLFNRSAIVRCVNNRGKLIARNIGNGRSIIYRDGTPLEEVKKLVEETK